MQDGQLFGLRRGFENPLTHPERIDLVRIALQYKQRRMDLRNTAHIVPGVGNQF